MQSLQPLPQDYQGRVAKFQAAVAKGGATLRRVQEKAVRRSEVCLAVYSGHVTMGRSRFDHSIACAI
jgi:hypothetical protein